MNLWLAEGGADAERESTVLLWAAEQLDNYWVEFPLLQTPGGCEANNVKINLLRNIEILLIIWKYILHKFSFDVLGFHYKYIMWTR